MTRILVASGFHAPVRGEIVEFRDAVFVLDDAGTILSMTEGGAIPDNATHLPPGHILLPGFVDLHIHAPQYPQLGTALDVPLEDWLQVHTFPLERRYADLTFARTVYEALVSDLLAMGTTTAVYYGTVHVPATQLLADICLAKGQRAFVGKVAMDDPAGCPPTYRDASPAEAVAGTRAVIDHIRNHPGNAAGLVQPIITPRFIPACTDETLTALGALAAETGVRVQTHVSKSDWEHGFVRARHGVSDAESLDRFGLMTPHAVLAHGTHLSDSDMGLIHTRGACVAHCPLSNAYFAGAIFPLRAALDRGLHLGLGSDISGGPSGSLWDAARMAVAASRIREGGTAAADATRGEPGARVDFRTAFHLATAGGGAALGLPVGHFGPGMQFDAMAIDPTAPQGTIRLWPGQSGSIVLEKILHTAARANIAAVWVAGHPVISCGVPGSP